MAMASRGILRRRDATLDLFRTFSSSSVACGSFGCEETPSVLRQGIASGAVSDRESGRGGWCRTEILRTNPSQLHESRTHLLFTNVECRRIGRPSSTVGARALSTLREERRRQDSVEHTEEEEDLDYYMKSQYNEETGTESETEEEEEEEELLTEEPEDDLLSKLKRNERGKYDNVAAVLGDPRVLAAAHERLNQKRKNWTLASNELEISHLPRANREVKVDSSWYREAAYQLRTGSYAFQPPKRLEVARRGRGEAREVVFVRSREQVVQEAARAILERIYGVNSTLCVHSALKSVKQGWRGVSWFLQFDVRVRDHESVQRRLLQLLAEEIEDPVFLEALRQMLQAGTVWVDINPSSEEEEKPQGSVLSPLLGDLYFHHLDLEINRIREEINNEAQA